MNFQTRSNKIRGLDLWLEADKGVTPSGGPISTWADQSGHGNNATQTTTGNKPALVPNVLNGLPVVRFNGTSSYLNLPYFMEYATQGEGFVVLRNKVSGFSGTGYGSLWFLGDSTVLLGDPVVCPTGYPYYYRDSITENFGSTNIFHIPVSLESLGNFNVYEVSSQTDNWNAWINGVSLYHSSDSHIVSFGNQCLNLGRWTKYFPNSQYGNYYWWFEGDVAEVLVFNRALSTDERATINAYLKGKYGL